MTEQKFKVGDRVKFAGTEGVVKRILNERQKDEILLVVFDDNNGELWFGKDGSLNVWEVKFLDRLTLIERPKRMVKKKVTMYQPVMKFKDDDLGVWYEINCELCASEELAMKKGDVVGTHAVEVEMLEEGDV